MPEATNIFAQWAHMLLVWIGFGTLVGLLAKAILPGKDPGGAFATVVIGVLGSIIGAGVLVFFSDNLRVSPLSVPASWSPSSHVAHPCDLSHSERQRLQIRHAGFGKMRRKRRISVVEDK